MAQTRRAPAQGDLDAPLRYKVYLNVTPALREFRRTLGKANHDLNTARAGLIELARFPEPPKIRFAIHWCPRDLRAAAAEAEAFAVKAVLVYAVDALDRYMRMIASAPTVLRDDKVLSLLRAEFQSLPATDPPTRAEVLALSTELAAKPSEAEGLLRSFRTKHLSRAFRPGMLPRFDSLMSLCPTVPANHRAAVHFLVIWRNRHVHGDTTDSVARLIESDWQRGFPELRRSNARADGDGLLKRFVGQQDPTADDLTTLLGLLHMTISTADKDLVASADAETYALKSLARSIGALDHPVQFAKDMWGKGVYARAIRLLNMTVDGGFHRVPRKKVPQGANVVSDEFWLKYARMSRSKFLAETGSYAQEDHSVT
jgi:hypothetical protein